MRKSSVCIGLVTIMVAISMAQGIAQDTCPVGRSPITVITPTGKIKTLCVPNSAVPGLENAAENAPGTITPAQCPCFSQGEVSTAVQAASSVYNYTQMTFFDALGNACRYVSIIGLGFEFSAMKKQVAQNEPCITVQIFPIGSLTNNGCYKQVGSSSSLLLGNIQPEESSVCVALIDTYAQ